MNFLAPYIDQFKPHAKHVGLRAEAYAERICAKLDAIHESLQTEDFQERRVRRSVIGTGGVITDIGTWALVQQVPVGQQWELEFANLYAPGGAAKSAISVGNMVVMGTGVAAAGTNTLQGLNIPLYGGDIVNAYCDAGAFLYLQFKVRNKKPVRHTISAGDIAQAPDRMDGKTEVELTERHEVENLTAGRNVIGARAN